MYRLLLLALFGSVLSMPAYAKEEGAGSAKSSQGELIKETKEVMSAELAKARQERDEFVNKAQKDLDELNKKILELKKKALNKSGEAKVNLEKNIHKIEQKQHIAEQKLAEAKSATIEKWQELKAGVSNAIKRLNQALNNE